MKKALFLLAGVAIMWLITAAVLLLPIAVVGWFIIGAALTGVGVILGHVIYEAITPWERQ